MSYRCVFFLMRRRPPRVTRTVPLIPYTTPFRSWQIATLAFQIPFVVAQAATIRVGLSYGARDRHGIALAGQASLILGIGFMVLTAAIMWLFPRAVLSIYIDVDAARNVADRKSTRLNSSH